MCVCIYVCVCVRVSVCCNLCMKKEECKQTENETIGVTYKVDDDIVEVLEGRAVSDGQQRDTCLLTCLRVCVCVCVCVCV